MKINFKFFNFASIKIRKRGRYIVKPLVFDNHFKDFVRAKKGLQCFVNEIKKIQKTNSDVIINSWRNKKNVELKETNSEAEPVLLVLMGYGYSRDYVINKIFDGYNGGCYNTEKEVNEKLLVNAKIIKLPIHIDQHSSKKERLIGLIKGEEFFPLFIDVNHSLYHNNSQKVISNLKMESLFKEILLKILILK